MPDPFTQKPLVASVYVDYEAISQNAALAQSLSPQAKLLCMIKANAYGHGITEVCRQLNLKCYGFGVARLDEAILLRENGCEKPIVVMSELLTTQKLADYVHHQFTPVVHADANASALAQACEEKQLPFWIKIDTGMHRLGLSETTVNQLATKADVIATHMHSADQLDNKSIDTQTDNFERMSGDSASRHFSLANSATLLRCEDSKNYATWLHKHAPTLANNKEIIRPGIMLYGADPLRVANSSSKKLQPAMTFAAPVIDLHKLRKGECVGYGQRWQAERDSLIATVAVGYGDGYPRHACNGTPVLINGQQGKLAGTVSMDMIGVDITDVDHVAIGDTAILWGDQLPVETIARCANTISYTLLTGITRRVKRL